MDLNIFSQKSLMDYSLDCLGHLTKMTGKTKYVSLKAVVDLDLF